MAAPPRKPPPVPHRGATLGWMLALGASVAASQNLAAPWLTPMAASLGVAPQDRDTVLGGWMSFAFYIAGAAASVLLGAGADTLPPLSLLLGVSCASSCISAGIGSTTSLLLVLLLRVAQGGLHGSLSPILFKAVGEMYDPEDRPGVSSYVSLALGGGTAIGQLGSGALASALRGLPDGWRAPC